MIYYKIPSSKKIVALTNEVLAHLNHHRQLGIKAKESGGQLFARFDGKIITIVKATGPRHSDKKGRFFFKPDRGAEQREINKMFSKGIHYVGDWHTHPEKVPVPSDKDISSMTECVKQSKHELDSFLLIIVGKSELPNGLWISLHGETDFEQLQPSNEPAGDIRT